MPVQVVYRHTSAELVAAAREAMRLRGVLTRTRLIGALLLATPTTLLFVPIMYTWLRRKPPVDLEREIAIQAGEIPGGAQGE